MNNVYIYILVMAGVTYLIRMLPLVLFKKEITSPFIKSFLYYVPYACLAAMTFPAILTATSAGIMQLIESGVIDYIDQTIEEDKYLAVNYPTNGYPYEYKKENSTYRMFYFSEFITPDITGLCEEQLDELNWDFSTGGNDNKKSAEINAFLNYFFKLYDVYKRNDLPREIFDQAISDRLDKLVK